MANYNDNTTYQEPIGKADAETIFGMDHDYTKEELDNAYHAAVETAVAEGDQEKLENLTAARDVLTEGFNAGAAVMTSDIKPDPIFVSQSASWGDIWDGFNKIGEARDKAGDKMSPISLSYVYNAAHYKACQKTNLPTDTDYPAPKRKNTPPMWYQGIYKLVQLPIWRLAFIVLVVLWGMGNIQSDPSANLFDDSFGIMFSWLGLLIIMLLNTIFGWATNLVRWGLMVIANKAVTAQLDHQELAAAKMYVAKNTKTSELAKPE